MSFIDRQRFDFEYFNSIIEVVVIEVLGVGIRNNNSIHHITRHSRDNLLLGIA